MAQPFSDVVRTLKLASVRLYLNSEGDKVEWLFNGCIDRSRRAISLVRPDAIHQLDQHAKIGKVKLGEHWLEAKLEDGCWVVEAEVCTEPHSENKAGDPLELARKYNFPLLNKNDEELLKLVTHIHVALGCPGTTVLSRHIRYQGVTIPNRIIESAVRNCLWCKVHKDRQPLRSDADGDLQPLVAESVAAVAQAEESSHWVLHVDTAFFTEPGFKGEAAFLVGVIRPANFYISFPLKTKADAPELIEHICSLFPRIARLRCDLAPELLKVKAVMTVPAPTQAKDANGGAENAVKLVKRQVRLALDQIKSKVMSVDSSKKMEKNFPYLWSYLLNTATHRLNSRINTVSDQTPFKAVYGIEPDYSRLPLVEALLRKQEKMRSAVAEAQRVIILNEVEPHKFDVLKMEKCNRDLQLSVDEEHSVNLTPFLLDLTPHNTPKPLLIAALTDERALKVKAPTGPEVNKKRQESFETLVDMNCFKKTTATDPGETVDVLFVVTQVGETLKARVALRGDAIKNPSVETTTELPDLWLRILSSIYFLSKKSPIMAADVKKAYYQTPYHGDVKLRLPKYLSPYGGFGGGEVVGLQRIIPGLPEGAREWCQYFEKTMTEELRFKKLDTGVYRRGDEDLLQFMDDLLISSPNATDTLLELNSHIKLDVPIEGWPTKYVGFSYLMSEEGIQLSLDAYLNTLPYDKSERILKKHDIVKLEALTDDLTSQNPTPKAIAEAHRLVGCLAWIAQGAPPLKVVHSLAASRLHGWPDEVIKVCHRAFKWYEEVRPSISVRQISGPLEVRVWADASYHQAKMKATLGVAVQICPFDAPVDYRDNVFFTRSVRTQKLMRSTMMAELEAAIVALAAYMKTASIVRTLFEPIGEIKKTSLITDSSALYKAVQKGSTTCSFSQTLLQFLQQEAKRNKVEILWVPTSAQLADNLTKFHDTVCAPEI